MIDKLVSSILASKVGEFVEGINQDTVKISILSGEFTMKNPALRSDALDSLELPITIESGFLGLLKFKLPWSSLTSQPAVVQISDLYALAGPRRQQDEEEQETRVQGTKQRLLQLTELLAGDEEEQEKNKEQGYFANLQATVVNNLQVEINNVHIRYQDTDRHGKPFAMGITIEQFTARSCNSEWEEQFVNPQESKKLFKIVKMKNFSLYWDSSGKRIPAKSKEQIGRDLQALIYAEKRPLKDIHYILDPINFDLRVRMNQEEDHDNVHDDAKIFVDCVCKQVAFCLDERQYDQMVNLAESFRNYSKSIRYIHYRPSSQPDKKPLDWWRYVIRSARKDYRDHNKFRNWKSIVEFIQDRNRYIYLFSQKKLATIEKSITISDEEIQELTDLEWKHTYEDIALFRVISRAYFKKNKEHVARAKREREEEQKKDQGFFSRLLHLGPTVRVEPLKITPGLIQELQDGLSQAELDSVRQDSHMPDEFPQQKLHFTLESGSFLLKDENRQQLLKGGFGGLNLRVEKRGESITFKTSLGTIELSDYFTKNTNFPHLIEPNSKADAVLSGEFDIKPADDKDIDYRVAMRMEPLNVVLSKPLLNRVVKFFSGPLLSKNSFRDLELAATIKFQQLKQQTQLQFKEMMGDQKAIDLNIDVAAPNLIIPHKPDDKESPLLILVLGQLTMKSDLDSTYEALKDAHKQGQKEGEQAASELMLYKKYKLDLKQIHALMATADEFRHKALEDIPRQRLLVDRFDMALSLDLCRAHSEKLALVKLDASFPELKGYLSSGKVTQLLLIVDAITASDQSGESPKDMSLDKLLEQVAKQESEKEGAQEQISTNERFLKASFSIPRASVFLEDDSSAEYLPVVELQLRKTEGTFEFNSHDMGLTLSLDSTNVIDHLQQKGDQYKYLATSELEGRGISDAMGALLEHNSSKQSVMLKYHGIPKNSPLFENLAHDLRMEFGMFHVMCNVLTLNHLLGLLNRAFDDYDKLREPTTDQLIEQKDPSKVEDSNAAELIRRKKEEDFTLVRFNAVFKSFGVSFPRKEKMMMEVFMSQSAIHVDMTDSNYLHVDGKLGAMKVNYNNDTIRKLYPDIMGIRGDDLIHFTVNYQLGAEHLPLPEDAEEGTIPLDALVKLELNSVQFNYVQVFIEDLVDYFITSQAIVMEQSTPMGALAQRAGQLQKATAAAATETNFGYDVVIHNPILFVPRSTTSREGLKADLGRIHISNRFFKQRKEGHKFVREDIRIDISDCTLLSCLLESDSHDQPILKNTDIHLHVIQTKDDNDHCFPGMSVDVDIPTIGVQVSEYQMKLLRSILEDNISSEMQSKLSKQSSQDFKNISVEKLRAAQLTEVVSEDASHSIMQSEEESEELVEQDLPEPYLDIQVDVKIDQIHAEILLGNGYDASVGITPLGTEPVALDRSKASTSLISGDVRLLKTQVHMYSDSSMIVDLSMQDLFMRDAREENNGNLFKDIFTTRLKKSLPLSQPYFQLHYHQQANSYQKVDINIYHPSLIFVPDIWIDLAIFILPFNEDILGSVNAFTSFWSEFSPKLTPNKEPNADKPQVQRMEGMEVSLFMIDAQMCILADGKRKDSHTILVQSDMDIIYSTSSEERKDKFLMKSRRIETTRSRMNNLKHSVPLVEPFRAGFQYLDNQANHICSIEAGVEQINATFTYRDVIVMQKIAEKWWPEINRYLTKDEKKEEKEEGQEDNEDEPMVERMEVPASNSEVDKPKVTQEARFTVRGARLVLVDDSNNQLSQRPLIQIQADNCFTEVMDWGYDLNAKAHTRVSISNYNDQLELWEEMLEPWDTAMSYTMENGVSVIKVTNKPININISKSFVEACLLTMSSISEEFDKDNKSPPDLLEAEVVEAVDDDKDAPVRHPFTIINETGIPMTYMTSEINSVPHRLKGMEEAPVIFTENQSGGKHSDTPATDWKERLDSLNKTLTVQLQDSTHLFEKPDYGLPIDRIGKYKLRLTGRRDESGSYVNGATFEVQSHRGDKVLIVRSNVLFINHTDADLQLLFASEGGNDVRQLPAGSTISAPLHFTESGEVQFMNHDAISQKKFARGDLNKERVILMNCMHPDKELFFNLHIKPENQDVLVTVSAPIVVENYLPVNSAFQFGHPKSNLSYSKKMEKGQKLHILDLNPSQPMLLSLSLHLYGRCRQPVDMRGFVSQERLFEFHDEKGRPLKVRMSVVQSPTKIITITLYCDMWIVNKTKLPLLFGPDHRNEISGGLALVESQMSAYQGIPTSDWFREPYPNEGHMYTADQGMFSRSEKIHLRIANSEWSDGIAIGAEGQQGQILIKTPPQGPKGVVCCYPLAVTVHSGPAQFWRTKKVIITPRYSMWNNTKSNLYYMQKDTKNKCPPFMIEPGRCVPFYLPREGVPFFRLNMDPEEWFWGGAISFDISGERSIKLRKREGDVYRILRLSFKLGAATGSSIIEVTECDEPDYLIQNKTPYKIQVRQTGSKTRDVILPDTEIPYAWDDYEKPDPSLSLLIDDATTEEQLSLDIFGQREIALPGKPQIRATVLPRKAVKVFELSMRPMQKAKGKKKQLDLSESAAIWDTLQLKATIHVEFIGVSVIDNTPREIMFASISKVQVVAQDSLTDQSVEIVVERFQVDNQLPNTPFPVALWPVIPPKENNERQAFFHLAAIRNKVVTSVTFIRDFNVSVGAMDLCLDESFITECLDFAQLIMNYMSTAEKNKSQALQLDDDEENEEEQLKKIENSKTEMWYFQTLQINPLAMTLTMNMDGVDREDLNRLVGFGRTFCNIDSASFQLAGLISRHTCSTANELVERLTTHYMRAGMTQLAKFIFGAEILGSPISLVSNLGTGVKDFLTEPAQGFTRSPAEFGVGIARGTTSLVKNTTVGIFNTTSKFTGAVASGAATLSFDQQYQLERDKSRVREKPKHAGQGLRFGAKAFGKGLWSGVSGVVSSPVRGASEDGFSGAMKGLARGAAGVVVKPTVGAIDSVSRVAEGIKNTATLWDDEKKKRVRLPRFIGPDKAIHAFDQTKAEGQQRLLSLDDERFAHDWFHSQYQLREGYLIVTNRTLIALDQSDAVQWFAPVHGIRGLQLTSRYILVYLKAKNKAKTFQRSSSEKFIDVPASKSNTLPAIYQELKEYLELLRNDRRFQVR